MKLNVKKAIKDSSKLLKDSRYGCTASMIRDIFDLSANEFDLICNGFDLGYIQGYKAAMKERG